MRMEKKTFFSLDLSEKEAENMFYEMDGNVGITKDTPLLQQLFKLLGANE